MNIRSICTYLWVIVAAAFVVAIGVTFRFGFVPDELFALPSEQFAYFAASATTSTDAAIGTPARLVIPDIGVDAKVQHVGITKAGNIGIPTNFTDVAWYRGGPRPGQPGTSIISGHVDNALGLAAVFKRLGELAIGARLFVTDEHGTKVAFKVTRVAVIGYTSPEAKQLFAPTSKSQLVLITCTGRWIKSAKTYDRRLIVFTERI